MEAPATRNLCRRTICPASHNHSLLVHWPYEVPKRSTPSDKTHPGWTHRKEDALVFVEAQLKDRLGQLMSSQPPRLKGFTKWHSLASQRSRILEKTPHFTNREINLIMGTFTQQSRAVQLLIAEPPTFGAVMSR